MRSSQTIDPINHLIAGAQRNLLGSELFRRHTLPDRLLDMKTHLLAAALAALALPTASYAAADVTINFATTAAIPGSNDLQGSLAALGLTRYASTGASLFLNGPATIAFEFLGSESGFNDMFSTSAGASHTENSSYSNFFAAPLMIGAQSFSFGSLASLLNFSSSGGMPATVGDNGFGIFLDPNLVSGSKVTTFYFGFDDEFTNQDDDYDDFVVRATVSSAVPEASTWAMMFGGFALLGLSLRRRQRHLVSFS